VEDAAAATDTVSTLVILLKVNTSSGVVKVREVLQDKLK
jgi:hypothetical protein